MFRAMLGEWIPMEAFAASLMDSTLDGEYFPLEASLARFLSLSILTEEIDLAVGYFFRIALPANTSISTRDSNSGKTRSR